MSVPALTPRGYWIRVVVFTAALLAYTWAAFLMAREHFWFGVGFIVLPILLSLARVGAPGFRRGPATRSGSP